MNTTAAAGVLKSLGITTVATFVPHDTPAGESPQLRWRVSVRRNGREIHSMEYWCGCAFAPSYKQNHGSAVSQAVRDECETGLRADGRPVRPPRAEDVLACLVFDVATADQTFENWAADAGYDPDSRAAERTYRECCTSAAAMKAAFTQNELETLAEAFRDW